MAASTSCSAASVSVGPQSPVSPKRFVNSDIVANPGSTVRIVPLTSVSNRTKQNGTLYLPSSVGLMNQREKGVPYSPGGVTIGTPHRGSEHNEHASRHLRHLRDHPHSIRPQVHRQVHQHHAPLATAPLVSPQQPPSLRLAPERLEQIRRGRLPLRHRGRSPRLL